MSPRERSPISSAASLLLSRSGERALSRERERTPSGNARMKSAQDPPFFRPRVDAAASAAYRDIATLHLLSSLRPSQGGREAGRGGSCYSRMSDHRMDRIVVLCDCRFLVDLPKFHPEIPKSRRVAILIAITENRWPKRLTAGDRRNFDHGTVMQLGASKVSNAKRRD